MFISSASQLKALVLAVGVRFTPEALEHARTVRAKTLQRVYNAPANAPANAPQEILLSDPDGYTTCVSAVAPVPDRTPVTVDAADDKLVIRGPGLDHSHSIGVNYVLQPDYYSTLLPSGQMITRVVSACGVSEMNIWPWHDCAIGRLCRFCGINGVHKKAGNADLLTSRRVSGEDSEAFLTWLTDVRFAVVAAQADIVYSRELFPMIISGNLTNVRLDLQAELYARIAREIEPLVSSRAGPEGLVATTAPPADCGLLRLQRDAGIRTMAINLEVFSERAFEIECPGKHRIGRDRYLRMLLKSVDIFGAGHAWTNFVLGLEPIESLLAGCKSLAKAGVTVGASVLHFDEGAKLRDKMPPTYEEIIWFYRELASIYKENELRPYFSSRALRSSLANEAYVGRL